MRLTAVQAEALQAGLDGTPVVLIQGPPGTGKTQSILGLLGIVLQAMQKGSLELLDEDQEDLFMEDEEMSESQNLELWSLTAPWILGRQVKR